MIPNEAVLSIRWIPTSHLMTWDQLLDESTVEYYRELMFECEGHVAPPVVEKIHEHTKFYRVHDGRHRIVAQRLLGRPHVRCVVVERP